MLLEFGGISALEGSISRTSASPRRVVARRFLTGPNDWTPDMEGVSEFRRYVAITLALAAREFPGAYRGNLSGALGAIAIPVAMLATYSLVFSRLIPVGMSRGNGESDYVFFLFGGLIVWNLFADVIVRAPGLFRNADHYVRRPRFPRSILVLAPCVASFYRALPWLAVYVVAMVLLGDDLGWSLVGSVAVLLATAVLSLGAALLLAVLGLLFKDLAEFMPPAVTLLFFLSPVLYPAERLRALDGRLLDFNPVGPLLHAMRSILLDGALPTAESVAPAAIGIAILLGLGLLAYRLVHRALPDLV